MSKRNLSLIMFLVFLFLVTGGGPASASNLENYGNNSLQATITKLDANHPDVIQAQRYDYKRMETTQDDLTKEMTSLKWVTRTQMAGSSTGIKYCTVAYEFQLANYVAIWDATQFRKATMGAPGEVMYHRVEISRNNFVQIFARNARVPEKTIEDALAREDIIHVRAYIKIYNDKNGNNQDDPGEEVSMIMGNENEIDTKASMFPYENRQDMHSRFQQVLIHPQGKPVPDFFSTPEGSTQWQESYKTCAKRYSGKSGTQIKIPIILRNSGAAGTTSFGANWWGSGWSNPVIPVQNVFVPEGGSKAFTFTVTVPAQGQEIRLVFCCNIDGNSPANEVNRANNNTVIEVTSNGLPGTSPGSAEDSKVGYIAVVPCTKTIFTGDFYDFKAYYHKPEGSATDVTEQSDWKVSNSSVARLETNKGRIKGLKPGNIKLSATYKGMTGTADVTVIDEPLPPPPNYSPKADFRISNPTPVEGQRVYLIDESTHEGRQYGERIVSWEWTIEGQPVSNEPDTEATWNKVGTYKVTLKVKDQDGDSDSCTKSVVVGPAMPAAVINVDPSAIILGRRIDISGDQSTAANGRTIKWDEMQWEFIKPDGAKATFTNRYPLLGRERTNALINQTGTWRVRLKVKDSDNNESEWAEETFTVHPDKPPVAKFWVVNETLRYAYNNNEVTVCDLSTPGDPDATLGDEITARQWTLYYDSNNNGVFTDSVDEIILPGQKKSAEIIQQSGNDPKPKIRFYKTGRYKLELRITESHLDGWDNRLVPGLSANTESMPIAEKTIMVINVAPTVAFDIIKKSPVDVQFAVDYTVPDAKYISLQSGQAGFTSKLIEGHVDPTIGAQRVAKGHLNVQSNVLISPININDGCFRGFHATNEPSWYNFEKGCGYYSGVYYSPYRWNIDTGDVVSGHLGIPQTNSFMYHGGLNTESLTGYSYTGNLDIVAERGKLSIYRGSALLDSLNVPQTNIQDYRTGPKGSTVTYHDSPVLIAPWKDDKTVVAYQNIRATSYDNWNDYLYLYLISNINGNIVDSRIYSGLVYHNLDSSDYDLGFKRYDIGVLMDNTMGINTTMRENSHTSGGDDTYYFKASVVTPSLQKREHGTVINSSYRDNGKIEVIKFNQNFYQEIITRGYGNDVRRTITLYDKSGYNRKLPTDNMRCFTMLEDGSFAYNTIEYDRRNKKYIGTLQYYSEDGIYKWSKTYETTFESSGHLRIPLYAGNSPYGAKFMDQYVILLTGDCDNTYSQHRIYSPYNSFMLADANTGVVVTEFPYTYYGNDNTFLFCQTGVGANNEFVLACISQLQGLEYVKKALGEHSWNSNNSNFLTSVIDGQYPDFNSDSLRAEIEQSLRSNHIKFSSISPPGTKAQTEAIANNGEGGWWINTNNNMSVPLNDLADKIIQSVNQDRGADNIVLVDQMVELRANYSDPENDPALQMRWTFDHNPITLNGIPLSNGVGWTSKKTETTNPLLTKFTAPGTWEVRSDAIDSPNTTNSYKYHAKAGQKWSNDDYLNVIVHRKPVAQFTVSNATSDKSGSQLAIQDQSYDPDLQYTDPKNMKGLRVWEWQYRKAGGNWETEYCYDNSGPRGFKVSGKYDIRLRVQDNFGAWSDWTDTAPITIVNRPPIADFTVIPNPVAVNHTTMITDCSRDPDGDPIVSYDWTIQTPSGNDVFTRNNPASFPYTWAVAGDYRVTLKVTDSEGLSATTSKIVKVRSGPPIAVIRLPDEVFTDEWFTADGTGSQAFDGKTIVKAWWQYLKPGAADWTSVYEQNIAALRPGETFLKYPIYPKEGEQGQWRIRLKVQDNEGLYSDIAEVEFVVQDGWQISGQIIPEVGERGRYMIVAAYAHRKDKPNEKYQIDSMKAELAYLDPACTTSGRAVAEGIETLNMPYDTNKADYRVKYLVGQEIYQTNRWPADGTYYIKITGQKGTTRKEIALPFSIKGNIWERFYIQTRSW